MMRRKAGVVLILAGLLLMAAALGLYLHNRREETRAAVSVAEVAPQLVQVIEQRQQEQERIPEETLPHFIKETEPDPNREMPVAEIDGNSYIGYLSIPELELELPVMSDWSYPQLRIAPCRYVGSLYLDNLVLMAHNYDRHFGRIDELRTGDRIVFTDMDGLAVEYEVFALDILGPTDIDEMIAGEYDLTLFTCTYGGKSRVALRCIRADAHPLLIPAN